MVNVYDDLVKDIEPLGETENGLVESGKSQE